LFTFAVAPDLNQRTWSNREDVTLEKPETNVPEIEVNKKVFSTTLK
jgi:hypothetical protein